MAYAAFAGNYKFVEDFNKKGRKFTVGLNQFADLTHEQFSALRRGQLVRNNKPKNIKVLDVKVPSSVDWFDYLFIFNDNNNFIFLNN